MFRKAIELTPENQNLYTNLGGVYVQIGRYDDAIVALRRSIELRPTKDANSNLGAAYPTGLKLGLRTAWLPRSPYH